MKTLLRTFSVCAWFVVLFFSLHACMKDSLVRCDPEPGPDTTTYGKGDSILVRLQFSYTHNPDNADYFTEEVSELRLFLFDQNDNLSQDIYLTTSSLAGGNTCELKLPTGRYRSVVWTNFDDTRFHLENANNKGGNMYLQLMTHGQEVDNTYDDLFYGSISFEAVKDQSNDYHFPMRKYTNNITIYMAGLETRTIPGTLYSARISAPNGTYNFDNSQAADAQLIRYKPAYSAVLVEGKHYMQAQFKVLRLQLDEQITFELTYQGKLLQEENLLDLILQHFPNIRTNDDLDRYSDYVFVYEIEPVSGNLVLVGIQAGMDWNGPGQSGGI